MVDTLGPVHFVVSVVGVEAVRRRLEFFGYMQCTSCVSGRAPLFAVDVICAKNLIQFPINPFVSRPPLLGNYQDLLSSYTLSPLYSFQTLSLLNSSVPGSRVPSNHVLFPP